MTPEFTRTTLAPEEDAEVEFEYEYDQTTAEVGHLMFRMRSLDGRS